MASLKIPLLATILLISEGYSQFTGSGCGYPQRCGATTVSQSGTVIPAGHFCIPAIIKPLISTCQPAVSEPASYPPTRQAPTVPCATAPCADDDEDSELGRLLYLLICNIMDSKKNSGRRCSYNPSCSCDGNVDSGSGKRSGYNPSSSYDGHADSSDCYEPRAPCYGDDYDCTQPSPCPPPPPPPPYCSGSDSYTITTGDNNCPEINLVIRNRPCQGSEY